MTALLAESVDVILDNYADVIEGGSAYASGSTYTGIAGRHSHDEFAETAITAGNGSTTTSIVWSNSYGATRFVKTDTPPWFLVGTSGTAANVGAARKISAVSSTAITVAAFPSTPAQNDGYVFREGFKRAPDNWDIEDPDIGTDEGHDRHFQLSLIPGKRWPLYGNTTETYEGELNLRVRFLKHSRARIATHSVIENVLYFRSVMTRPGNRDGTYVQLVECGSTEPEVPINDSKRIVVLDKYRCVFRVGADFL